MCGRADSGAVAAYALARVRFVHVARLLPPTPPLYAVRESGTTYKSRDKVGHTVRPYFFILMTTLEGGAVDKRGVGRNGKARRVKCTPKVRQTLGGAFYYAKEETQHKILARVQDICYNGYAREPFRI